MRSIESILEDLNSNLLREQSLAESPKLMMKAAEELDEEKPKLMLKAAEELDEEREVNRTHPHPHPHLHPHATRI